VNGVRRFLQPGWMVGHVLVVLSAVVCVRLAFWQFGRSEDFDGTIQNLGYGFLWPAFGVAFIYMWVQFIRLEAERIRQDEREHAESLSLVMAEAESLTAGAAETTAERRRPGDADRTGEIPDNAFPAGANSGNGTIDEPSSSGRESDFVGVVGDEDVDDAELTAYNRALAALADKDRRAR